MSESRNNLKRILPGVLVSIVLIAIILYFVDIKTTLEALSKANYALIGIAFTLSFVWLAVRAIVWRTLLRDKPTYKDVFYTVGEGYLLNNFLPFRLGEIGRAFLLSRKSGGLTFAEIIPTIVIERVVDLIISAVVFLAALPYVVNSESSPTLGYVIGGIMLFGLVLMYILARNNQWALDLFHKLSGRFPALQKGGGNFLESFFQGLGVLTNGWLFLQTTGAYCAIRPAGGGYTNAIAARGVELSLGDIWAPVIIQTRGYEEPVVVAGVEVVCAAVMAGPWGVLSNGRGPHGGEL